MFQERFTEERVLTCVGGDDDSCGPWSITTFEAVWTETYIVLITGFRFFEGSFQILVRCSSIHESESSDSDDIFD